MKATTKPEVPPDPGSKTTSQARTLRSRASDVLARVSLRTKLVAIFSALLLAGLTASGTATLQFLNSYLVSQVDAQLREDLPKVIAAAGEQCAGALGGTIVTEDSLGRSSSVPLDYHWQFESGDGKVLCASPSTPFSRTTDVPELSNLNSSEVLFDDGRRTYATNQVGSESGKTQWRVLKINIDNSDYSFSVAANLIDAQETTGRVRLLLVCLGGAAVLLGSLLGFAAVRHSLRPLQDVEKTAAAIAAGDLSKRIPALPETTEVGHLAAALNEMLTQIESAFAVQKASEERMRRFVSDASHELRTPLASIRGFGELYRMGAITDESDVTQTMRRIEDESIRMGSLVEDLLALARLDERQPLRQEPIDLAIIAVDAVSDVRGLDPEREVTVLNSLGEDAIVAGTTALGDDGRIRQVVANLVGNAVHHTPSGSPIEILVGPAGPAEACLAIRDHGPGLDPAQVERVFERFYRVDASRQRGRGGGSGLGLAIVAATVSALKGRVSITETAGGGATFTLTLPAAPRGAPDGDSYVGDDHLDSSDTAPAAPQNVQRTTGRNVQGTTLNHSNTDQISDDSVTDL